MNNINNEQWTSMWLVRAHNNLELFLRHRKNCSSFRSDERWEAFYTVPWREPWTVVRQAIPFRCLGLTSGTHATVCVAKGNVQGTHANTKKETRFVVCWGGREVVLGFFCLFVCLYTQILHRITTTGINTYRGYREKDNEKRKRGNKDMRLGIEWVLLGERCICSVWQIAYLETTKAIYVEGKLAVKTHRSPRNDS